MERLRAVKGMHDVLPEELPRWRRVEERFRELAERYGFGEVRPPLVEPTALFVRSIGEVTDIVEKEMYTFVDKGEQSLTLRPEGTASVVRTYLEHSVHARSPVTKWFYLGPMYRRERPAKGRYRQFHQLGAEVFGDPGPFVDAELIDLVVRFLDDLGVREIEVLVNSLGSGESRARYREALVEFLTPHAADLSDDSKRRLATNPLRVLDSKVPADIAVTQNAPSLLAFLEDDDRTHFEELQRILDRWGTPYRVEPRLVRGLDYYDRTLFEVKGTGGDLGAQNTLCGGGRYDGLVAQLGGPDTPAIGFAIGVERVLLAMAEPEPSPTLDAFVVAAAAELREEAALLARELRNAGLRVDADLRGQSLKSQLRRADKSGARVALLLGPDELERGTVQVKDLVAHDQEDAPRDEVAARVRARLGAGG
ncbi:MAG TPA: histidine--tRNA ligase [Polyangiaceae bacterium LLY-WYZ-14_1]|nr:histidine--tRNA ligase [Polyangiaceae bacterium LLY-WYZ-14_1]